MLRSCVYIKKIFTPREAGISINASKVEMLEETQMKLSHGKIRIVLIIYKQLPA